MKSSLRFGIATAAAVALASCSPDFAPTATLVKSAPANSIIPGGGSVVAVFVIGDAEAHQVGDAVNFWGAQWWKNNAMTGTTSDGVAAFKGYADLSDSACGGTWISRPGNSSGPPATLDPVGFAVIVTSGVVKSGADVRGDIQQILYVTPDGGYGPNPGHAGTGVVTAAYCTR